MLVDVEVACRLDLQVEAAVAGEQFQHVIEERYPGREAATARTIEIERNADLRFIGVAGDLRLPCHGGDQFSITICFD